MSGGHARPQTYSNVQLRAKDVSMDSVIPFTFEAQTPGSGKIKLDGQAGPINRVDAAQTPLSATLNVNRMDLASTGFLDPASGLAWSGESTRSVSPSFIPFTSNICR